MQEDRSEMAAKRASEKAKSPRVFGQARKPAKMLRAGLYARVSTNDQQTIPLQIRALREYAVRRRWTIAMQVKEVGSGASQRQLREKLLDAARRREIDVVLVGRLDRWGRSVADLLATLQELGAPRRRLRLTDRGAGPDDTGRTGDGGSVGRVRRV
jgi:DNA invertase Pin-like site-specific DNA recombinase